jgi:hypothetical protein
MKTFLRLVKTFLRFLKLYAACFVLFVGGLSAWFIVHGGLIIRECLIMAAGLAVTAAIILMASTKE